jgi:hypothetical protein
MTFPEIKPTCPAPEAACPVCEFQSPRQLPFKIMRIPNVYICPNCLNIVIPITIAVHRKMDVYLNPLQCLPSPPEPCNVVAYECRSFRLLTTAERDVYESSDAAVAAVQRLRRTKL